MADTAYDRLQQSVIDWQDKYTAKATELSKLKGDPEMRALQIILDQLGWNNKPNSWIDSSGTEFTDPATHQRAAAQVSAWSARIKQYEGELIDYQNNLNLAKQAVIDYQKNSPTLGAQIAADKEKSLAQIAASNAQAAQAFVSANAKTLVIVLIVFTVVIIGIVFYRKLQKSKTA